MFLFVYFFFFCAVTSTASAGAGAKGAADPDEIPYGLRNKKIKNYFWSRDIHHHRHRSYRFCLVTFDL